MPVDPALLTRLTPDELAELDALLAGVAPPLWQPLPGPQTVAYTSAADVIGYGGAAGGGKTDLACGLALTRHTVSAIFRREATQLNGVIERLSELLGGRDGFNGRSIWRLDGHGRAGCRIEFGSTPHAGDETRHQGRPKDLLVFDEATNFLETQARFLMGWNRTTVPGQKCTTLLTFNPPTTAEGQWVIQYFAPWLDRAHPNPAAAGELRWFGSVAGKDVAVPDARPFVLDGDTPVYEFDPKDFSATAIITPRSRTFVPSRITDNPYLMQSGYMSTLQSLPEPLRSQMLNGDFSAGMEDDPWQIIPTAWVQAAQDRWQPRDAKGPMDGMGVDVARGGRDESIIARRHGVWFDQLVCLPGPASPDGPTLAGQVITLRRDRAPVHIDIVGWGSSPYDFLRGNGVQTLGINGAAKSNGITRDGRLRFVNLRAELWWRLREALDPTAPQPLALPPDPQLRADLCAPKWHLTPSGIQVEKKEDLKGRIGRSPDRGDAVVLALIATAKEAIDGPVQMAVSEFDPYAG
ncbi:terminase [Novispirillum itersonii]|uniref:terminase n=1 Tax=Novispirillum itersonii TaxID=189 RepID=UPI00037AA0D8|nr:terminase [Novispirillum itersonii]